MQGKVNWEERKQQYLKTQIDWDKLRAYAGRVARETKKPTQVLQVTKTQMVEEKAPGLMGLLGRKVKKPQQVTTTQQADYWVLMTRTSGWKEEGTKNGRLYEEEESSTHLYCLRKNGELFVRTTVSTQKLLYHNRGANLYDKSSPPKERPLNEADALLFDWAPWKKEYTQGGTRHWSDTEQGNRLLVHAKGMGLSLALKKLLESK